MFTVIVTFICAFASGYYVGKRRLRKPKDSTTLYQSSNTK